MPCTEILNILGNMDLRKLLFLFSTVFWYFEIYYRFITGAKITAFSFELMNKD